MKKRRSQTYSYETVTGHEVTIELDGSDGHSLTANDNLFSINKGKEAIMIGLFDNGVSDGLSNSFEKIGRKRDHILDSEVSWAWLCKDKQERGAILKLLATRCLVIVHVANPEDVEEAYSHFRFSVS